MLLVAGITNTFPVFLPALLADFGGSRAATSAGGALLSPWGWPSWPGAC